MAECAYCKTDTALYDGAAAVCVQCAKMSPEMRDAKAKLFHDLAEATLRAESASTAFNATATSIPNGIPHDVQRIHNASRNLSAARLERMKAHTRLNDFLERGIVPEDLKRSG
jgi:hypothetical protein